MIRTERADVIVEAGGDTVAGPGADGEVIITGPAEIGVNAEADAPKTLLSTKVRQCLEFTPVDVERALRVTYSLGRCRGILGGSILRGVLGGSILRGVFGRSIVRRVAVVVIAVIIVGSIGRSLGGGCIDRGVDGRTADGDGEDGAEDEEKLSEKHHGVS